MQEGVYKTAPTEKWNSERGLSPNLASSPDGANSQEKVLSVDEQEQCYQNK